eukprot:COSAG02_NODE_36018_length_460_cov_0.664820_2_plen_24_part_01
MSSVPGRLDEAVLECAGGSLGSVS